MPLKSATLPFLSFVSFSLESRFLAKQECIDPRPGFGVASQVILRTDQIPFLTPQQHLYLVFEIGIVSPPSSVSFFVNMFVHEVANSDYYQDRDCSQYTNNYNLNSKEWEEGREGERERGGEGWEGENERERRDIQTKRETERKQYNLQLKFDGNLSKLLLSLHHLSTTFSRSLFLSSKKHSHARHSTSFESGTTLLHVLKGHRERGGQQTKVLF